MHMLATVEGTHSCGVLWGPRLPKIRQISVAAVEGNERLLANISVFVSAASKQQKRTWLVRRFAYGSTCATYVHAASERVRRPQFQDMGHMTISSYDALPDDAFVRLRGTAAARGHPQKLGL